MRRSFLRVVRTKAWTKAGGSLRSPTLTRMWRLYLECGHHKDQSSVGRGCPSLTATCPFGCAPARDPGGKGE